MNVSEMGLDLIKHEEGLIPADAAGLYHAYHGKADRAGIWTIGWGVTWKPDGSAVREGDTATAEEIESWLDWHVKRTADGIDAHLGGKELTQPQFDSLVSFGYNIGVQGLLTSTLFKKVLVNPNDPSISAVQMAGNVPKINTSEFMKWVHSNGQVVDDLVFRRATEAKLYSNGILNYFGH